MKLGRGTIYGLVTLVFALLLMSIALWSYRVYIAAFLVTCGAVTLVIVIWRLWIPGHLALQERKDKKLNADRDYGLRDRVVSIGERPGYSTKYDANGTIEVIAPQFPRVQASEAQQEMLQSTASLKQIEGPQVPHPYDLQEEFENWRPSLKSVFLGRTAQGPIYVPVEKLWHVAFTGPTGGGKTNILRMLMMQLVSDYIRAQCYLCDIHYAPIKTLSDGTKIDWRPIANRLALPPIRHTSEIYDLVEWVARKELQQRIDREYRGEPIGQPLTLAMEELPAVVDERPEISAHMAKIWRQGRQYGICFIGSTQDALVKTLGTGSGPRECLRTGYYTGGDPKTAKIILDLQNGQKIDEDGLGIDGLSYVKTTLHSAAQARVPLASNNACYSLLGVFVAGNSGNTFGNATETPRQASFYDRDTQPFTVSGSLVDDEREEPITEPGNAIGNDLKEAIRRMRKHGMPHRDIASLVGLSGRKYNVYQQICAELGLEA